ncbi:M23 family metallopeptidase [Streptosporangium sp. 'caverna']|uniref:M23 family metallopeptidase n=1 Tax=Streptosporangium sp. 'caverna' TaxID=2202249 RepID=UPI001EF8A53A|nr:M23 family metallopeptidase [Streptosporangium sp. 'caverna']
MKIRGFTAGAALLLSLTGAVALAPAAGATGTSSTASTASAGPGFQMPFPCGQSWTGKNGSSAHESWEIDFNRGSSATADLGDTVVAAAAGTVVTSANQGSVNGFGNLVKIDHGGGWTTFYAHLRVRSVSAGTRVAMGQKIGEVGNTTKPGASVPPHLHFEVRTSGTYPANIQKAVFNGVTFGYPGQTLASKNCGGGSGGGGGSTNPYTPEKICGSGYTVIDSAAIGSAGKAYLLYNKANGRNCVTTVKSTSLGKASAVSAYLEVQGKARATDAGNFDYYAGPVTAAGAKKCIKWGGKVGSAVYDSPLEHCG